MRVPNLEQPPAPPFLTQASAPSFFSLALHVRLSRTTYDSSVSQLTSYLVGIGVGDVLISLLIIIIMALPVLLDKSNRVRIVLVSRSKAAAAGTKIFVTTVASHTLEENAARVKEGAVAAAKGAAAAAGKGAKAGMDKVKTAASALTGASDSDAELGQSQQLHETSSASVPSADAIAGPESIPQVASSAAAAKFGEKLQEFIWAMLPMSLVSDVCLQYT
jgi:hypothetical protein